MRKSLTYILITLLIANVCVAIQIFSDQTQSSTYFLNVGQGDAELITYKGMHILIDAGKDAKASAELERILGRKKRIDIAILTHADSDHTGGIYKILDRFFVGALLVGNGHNEDWGPIISYAKGKGVPFFEFDMYDTIAYKGGRITALWPDHAYETKNDNEKSLVLKYEQPDYSILFAGDISEKIENILRNMHDIDTDVLKVPHHGSKFSSSDTFLSAVSPILSIIEVGKNSYGHPTQEAIQRLGVVGSHILRTDTHGTMQVYKKGDALRVESL